MTRYSPIYGAAASEPPRTRPAASPAPSIAWSRISSASASARPNYAALIEIPLRLREHATAQRAAVAEPQAALADIERRAMLELGIDAKERALGRSAPQAGRRR